MLKKSDLTVIRGGALSQSVPDEKFIDAYVTDTRLMGVLVIYIKWQLSGIVGAGRKGRYTHQFFYIETTEAGIESYRGVTGEDVDELRLLEQSMLGGLGAGRVPLSMDEAVFLVQRYAEMTRSFGNPLPDETEEYAFILRRESALAPESADGLFFKLCGEIESENKLINYFLMRYFAKDFFPVDRLATVPVDHGQMERAGLATLCRNQITPPEEAAGHIKGTYVCESVIEEDRGHLIVVSEIGVTREEGHFAVSSFEISTSLAISPAEAAMKLARPEYVTVYEISGSVDNVLYDLDIRYAGALQNLTEGGKLYISFNDDNRHMSNRVYLLNDDVKEILYVTVEDQLIVGCYTLAGRMTGKCTSLPRGYWT